ncbi:MAG: hypothetical protein ACR2IJ_00510 [Fluviibacter sp.]
MMQIRVTIEAVITLPEGTRVPESGRAFSLPSGDWVKPWIVLEMNDEVDMALGAMNEAGVGITETEIHWFEEEAA